MEKSKSTTRFSYFRRLLKVTIIFSCLFVCNFSPLASLVSGRIRVEHVQGISVHQEDAYCFAGVPCRFTLRVPRIPPVLIQTTVQALPDGVSFLGAKKDEYYTGDERSTLIQLEFLFEEAGVYEMPSLAARVDSFSYRFPFDTVTVNENLNIVEPTLITTLSTDMSKIFAGESVVFSVWNTNASYISEITWKLPENAIFTEIYRNQEKISLSNYSPEKRLLIQFEWIPILAGEFELPVISAVAETFNGRTLSISSQPIKGIVFPSASKSDSGNTTLSNGTNNIDAFPSAFSKISNITENTISIKNTDEALQQLVTLRQRERKSILVLNNRYERLKIEKDLGLTESENEPREIFKIVFLILAFVTIVIAIIFYIIKKQKIAILFFILFVFSTFGTIWWFSVCSIQYGIFLGGKYKTVPESSSSDLGSAEAGTRVKIISNTSSWLYVDFGNEKKGWIQDKLVLFIN